MGKNKQTQNDPAMLLARVWFVSFPRKDEVDLSLCEHHPHLLLSLCQTTPGWLLSHHVWERCARLPGMPHTVPASPGPRSPVQSIPRHGGKGSDSNATPGWEAGTSLSPPQAQPVALCD